MEQRNCEEVISENADPWAWNSSREVLTTAWHYFKAFSVTFGPSLSADSWEQSRCFSSAPVVTAAFSHSLLQGQIKDTKTDLPQTKARGPFSPNPFCDDNQEQEPVSVWAADGSRKEEIMQERRNAEGKGISLDI